MTKDCANDSDSFDDSCSLLTSDSYNLGIQMLSMFYILLANFRRDPICRWRSASVDDVVSKLDYGPLSNGPRSARQLDQAPC